MLSCQDCERYLEAFLDQELDVKESLDMQAHLSDCPACLEAAEAERTYRRFVREQLQEVALPQAMKLQMIRQAMDGAPGQRAVIEPKISWWARLNTWIRPKDFALGMASATVLLLVLYGPISLQSKADDTTHRLLQDASMAYQANQLQPMPLGVSDSDDKAVADWFSRKLTYTFKVPCITDTATKLMGGRLCRLLDRQSATFVYKRNGKDVLLFAFRGDGVSLPARNRVRVQDQDLYLHNVSGRPVAAWKHGGIVYSMVGDLNRDDILSIAKTMHYR